MQRRASLLAAALAAGTFLGTPVQADWSDNFDGGFQQSWTFVGNAADSPPAHTDVSLVSNGLLMQYKPASLGQGNYNETVVGLVAETFTDVTVRATVNPQGTTPNIVQGEVVANNDVFVAARSNGLTGYLLALDWHHGYVNIVRVDGVGQIFVPQEGNGYTPSITMSGADLSQPYVLELSVIGSEITGKVFAADGVTQLYSTMTWNDSTYSSGWSGVGAAMNADLVPPAGGGPYIASFINAGFDNVSAAAIPEPASLALVGLGALLVMGKRRR